MNINEDTCEWLGCPTPLEMYKHHCSMIEDEVSELQVQLRKARANISGLVQMNDALATGKAKVEKTLKIALVEISGLKERCSEPAILGMKLVAEQRDYLLRENQRLLAELKRLKETSA
ncbi:hypothetical protein RGV33_12275 [Pseudomonas sp. Bout1]|uniref:hypothetical protein n=1 Tax=Pseudomonas sp. Bout1 TaxID=3048600 RepID=UPI002AB38C15|nr:hypothetical protein [Pseudomonas sp. Bout1]MDY7532444.1 hypothetical protein [Pseudomonas sp. Bout1]MEB0184128.1 hypothetical protein [Pseudomonas sp. Bout1]